MIGIVRFTSLVLLLVGGCNRLPVGVAPDLSSPPDLPTTIVAGEANPRFIVVDPIHGRLYWTNSYPPGGSVRRSSTDGTDVQTVDGGPRSADGIAVDAANTYWTGITANEVQATPLDRIAPTAIATPTAPGRIISDGTDVFWAGQDEVDRLPAGGGTPTTIYPALGHYLNFIATDGERLFFGDHDTAASPGTTRIVQIDKDGANPIALVSSPTSISAIAAGGGFVYWIDAFDVHRVPVGGGADAVIAHDQQSPLADITVDDQHVYWTAYDPSGAAEGHVTRSNLDGSAAVAVAEHAPGPAGITFDAQYLYWCNRGGLAVIGDGSIMRLTK